MAENGVWKRLLGIFRRKRPPDGNWDGSRRSRRNPPDFDPYARAGVRNKRNPNDKGAMVAVAEPDDD